MSGTQIDVRLAYGDDDLVVGFPADRTTVVSPTFAPGVADPRAELQRALRQPEAGASKLDEPLMADDPMASPPLGS